ncbi:MAG: hypothetical protein ACR65Z_00450 [Methylocystis sp.]
MTTQIFLLVLLTTRISLKHPASGLAPSHFGGRTPSAFAVSLAAAVIRSAAPITLAK